MQVLFKVQEWGYLIVGSSRRSGIPVEFNNISKWAENNNLRLNTGKSKEMIISRRRKYDKQPNQQVDIERVNSMKILGITLNSELKVDEHIESLIKSSLTSLYALRILKAHGLRKEVIHKVTEAIIGPNVQNTICRSSVVGSDTSQRYPQN